MAWKPTYQPPEQALARVTADCVPPFERLLKAATELGMQPKIRSSLRTCKEQDEQVRLGFSHAPGCNSWHVLGRALDLDMSPNVCTTYQKLGELWESWGGVWGGRFGGFGACGDSGHYEWHPGIKRSELCPNPSACESAMQASFELGRRLAPPPVRAAMGTLGWSMVGLGVTGVGLLVTRWLRLW